MAQESWPDTPAPTVGLVATLAALAVVVLPYAVLSATDAAVYYGSAIFVPVHLVVGLLGSVAIVVFAAGRNGRTDPPTAAGAAIVLAAFMAVLVLWWAIAVGDLVGSFAVDATFGYHRWLLLTATLAVAASAGWYARAVLPGAGT